MSGRRFSFSKGERFGKRINRAPSPLLAHIVPWATIMLGSLVPAWLVIASAPLFPPLGYLMLLSWRQLRPGLLPVWAGLPLGVFDDLFSGQPMGNAVFLWSLSVIVLDMVEDRLPWRNFFIEWMVAAGLIASYIWLGVGIANLAGAATPYYVVVPQILLSITIYPLIGRLIAALDRLRLRPVKDIGG